MTQARLQKVRQVLASRQPDVNVLLDQVHKPHNLSAVIRTCDAVGVPEVSAVETPDQSLRAYRSTSQGSEQWVHLNMVAEATAAIARFRQAGHQVLAAHLSEEAVDFRSIDFTRPTTLVLGAEKWGVSPATAAAADGHVIIPTYGMVESLNVSVAAAVLLFEMQRQRLQAGMYQPGQAVDNRRCFEWLHPGLARYYRRKGLPYPPLDEAGDIRATSAQKRYLP